VVRVFTGEGTVGQRGKGAKGLRPAGQCYPGCHAVASSRLFCVLDAAILCLLSPWSSLSGSHVLPCPVIFRLFGSFGAIVSSFVIFGTTISN